MSTAPFGCSYLSPANTSISLLSEFKSGPEMNNVPAIKAHIPIRTTYNQFLRTFHFLIPIPLFIRLQ